MSLKDKQIDAVVVGTGPGGATVAKELSHIIIGLGKRLAKHLSGELSW